MGDTICEATEEVGGLLRGEEAIPVRCENVSELGETYKLLCEKEGVEIRLNTRVTKEYAEKEAPDAIIIVAAGSDPVIPPIPALRQAEKIILAEHYHLEKDRVGDDVVIIGGGLVGRELAALPG